MQRVTHGRAFVATSLPAFAQPYARATGNPAAPPRVGTDMISVITPAHASCNPYLRECYESLRAQTFTDWEWVVLPNNGGATALDAPEEALCDHRVRWIEFAQLTGEGGVGALKRHATALARGEIVLELDGDDLLTPTALERVSDAFARGADMVYSDFAEFHDRTWRPNVYSSAYGWEHYAFTAPNGAQLEAMRAPALTPQNARAIMFAPNHVRAWKREHALKRRADLEVGDDQALLLDLYLSEAKIVHIPECLYLYRVHEGNTVKARNAQIQRVDAQLYEAHIEGLALKFARDRDLHAIDLCAWENTRPGFEGADAHAFRHGGGWDVDLNEPWPWADSSVGVLRASDALEHLRDPIHVMNEAYRVLAPGGFFLTHTPSTEGLGAWCDPTHVSFWNRLSWRYYTDPAYARYVPAFKGRFAMSRPERRLDYGDGLVYTEAHLIALGTGYHHMGVDLWR